MVDAAYRIPGKNEYYFFSGRQYGRIRFPQNSSDNSLVAGPTHIRKGWNTLSKAGFGRVDTIVPVPGKENELYVFFGGRYARIKLENYDDSWVNEGARTIENGWNSLVQAGFDTVDAALLAPGTESHIYFFRGMHYVRVDNSTDKMVLNVATIKSGWTSIAKAGFDCVDAIVPVLGQPHHYYVFRGDQFAVISIDSNRNDTLISGAKLISEAFKPLHDWV